MKFSQLSRAGYVSFDEEARTTSLTLETITKMKRELTDGETEKGSENGTEQEME